jgi:anti-anti-sigma regulatory factor
VTTITLPARCDQAAAEVLLPDLQEAFGGGAVVLDGRDVVQFGQATLQLIVSLAMSAERHGSPVTLLPSPALREAFDLSGFRALLDSMTS